MKKNILHANCDTQSRPANRRPFYVNELLLLISVKNSLLSKSPFVVTETRPYLFEERVKREKYYLCDSYFYYKFKRKKYVGVFLRVIELMKVK